MGTPKLAAHILERLAAASDARFNVVGVVTKQAISRTSAIVWSPARVRQMLADSAAVAVRKAMAHEFKPFTMAKPYRVQYALRASFPDSVAKLIDAVQFPGVEKIAGRSYRFTATDAKQIGLLYLTTSFGFFFVGGFMAMLMRAELARPGLQFLSLATEQQVVLQQWLAARLEQSLPKSVSRQFEVAQPDVLD